jgi:hypothetical protein
MLLASLDVDEALDSQLTDEECDGCEADVEEREGSDDESEEELDDELDEDVEEEEDDVDDDEDDDDEALDSLALLLELLLLLPSEVLVLICQLLDRRSAGTVR